MGGFNQSKKKKKKDGQDEWNSNGSLFPQGRKYTHNTHTRKPTAGEREVVVVVVVLVV